MKIYEGKDVVIRRKSRVHEVALYKPGEDMTYVEDGNKSGYVERMKERSAENA